MHASIVDNTAIASLLEANVEKLVAGEIDKATARCDFMLGLRKLGFWPLSQNEEWLNTIVDFNTEIRQGWRQYDDGLRQGVFDVFPCQELFVLCKNFPEPCDWSGRWISSGGTITQGRMVASKDSAVWLRLSDFGFPFPPYALRSGMWVKGVLRSEAVRLGVIGPRQSVSVRRWPRPSLMIFDPTKQIAEEV